MPTFYAPTIFAKPLDQITEADLTSYFQQERDETLNLEFKSYTDKPGDQRGQAAKDAEKIKGVLKTISAFLNSSGGLLIWGAPESVEVKRGEKKVKMCRGPLTPVPKYYDRDDFINKITGQISPVPAGVRMQPVQVAGGNYVYLFDVPESQNKPHQNDGRYYVRMDTRTDAAPHYLVYALCHQIKAPTLSLDIKVTENVFINSETGSFNPIAILFSAINQTPFVHDTNLYFIFSSETILFKGPESSRFASSFQLSNAADLLVFGLARVWECHLTLPSDFRQREHFFDVYYGGRQSSATKARYAVTAHALEITYHNMHRRPYKIHITLKEQTRLDGSIITKEE